jgi:hypothetical protein
MKKIHHAKRASVATSASIGYIAAFLVGLVTIGGCQRMKVKTESFIGPVYFADYKTFGWAEQEEKPLAHLTNPETSNPQLQNLVVETVTNVMAAKGYAPSNSPNFLIAYQAHISDKLATNLRYDTVSDTYVPAEVGSYEQGSLMLDFMDAKTKTLIWRGSATEVIKGDDNMDEQVRTAIRKILENFPSVR